ncbi:sensor histidine kinase [Prosthecomicrobium hirschii]|uniref:sensor histidine kinase n=1 Tax=Prosthecodimorpha hirschii TaxID=665126 RepID=UPI00128ECA4D|nr:HAMP domain-containing sensor histidine kinase [Prosthecomicrobium hirschii]
MISSALAVAAAGVALVVLADRHVERRLVQEVGAHLDQLTALLRVGARGPEVIDDLADPRFVRPFSGLYFQIVEAGDIKIRSRSLWDQTLPIPPEAPEGEVRELKGPRDQALMTLERRVSMAAEGGDLRTFRLFVGEDRAEIDGLVFDFALEAAAFLFVLVAFLTLAGWAYITVGLKPLENLRDLVLQVRRGKTRRLDGAFPNEVLPLVEELNGLIDAQEQAVERARARAGDLAHGLKTPLAVLSAESRSLRERGETEAADAIDIEVAGLSRFVERELARSRAAAVPYLNRLDLSRALDRMVGAMQRLPRGEELDWLVEIPPGLTAPLHPEDANEILGNLLDNARKWAAGRIEVSAHAAGERIEVVVADDGPGVPEARREAVLKRGIRLDETVQGSGLGLSIVDDLVTSYRGTLALSETPGGGLTVRVELPRSPSAVETE